MIGSAVVVLRGVASCNALGLAGKAFPDDRLVGVHVEGLGAKTGVDGGVATCKRACKHDDEWMEKHERIRITKDTIPGQRARGAWGAWRNNEAEWWMAW